MGTLLGSPVSSGTLRCHCGEPYTKTEERDTRMDFTYVWFLAVSLMLTHQHQGNLTSTLSSRH